MKKKILCGLMGTMMVLSLVACGKTDADKNDETTAVALTAADYKEYMTLCDYKNIEVEADKESLTVTQEEIQNEIDSYLSAYSEVNQIKEGTVNDGDTINLDFSGLLDGVAFANGTATDYTYTVGGTFIEDLDRQLVGLTVGQEYELPCRFPDSYDNDELKGKDVIFVVTVNYIEEEVIPEYNDEFVKKITGETEQPLNTTKEFEDSIIEYLQAEKQDNYDYDIYAQMMTYILDNSEIKSLPESEVNTTFERVKDNAEYEFNMYGQMYGFDTFESYITNLYSYESMEAFEEDAKSMAEEYVKEKMAINLIADAEGVDVTAEEILAYEEDLIASSSYESVDQLKEAYGDELESDVRFEILYNKIFDKLIGMAKIK